MTRRGVLKNPAISVENSYSVQMSMGAALTMAWDSATFYAPEIPTLRVAEFNMHSEEVRPQTTEKSGFTHQAELRSGFGERLAYLKRER
jgi:hypothetical protein